MEIKELANLRLSVFNSKEAGTMRDRTKERKTENSSKLQILIVGKFHLTFGEKVS